MSNVHVTGYFFFDSKIDYQPPHELQDFLNRGDAPICISFGSMVNRDAERIDRIVNEALTLANHRGVILSGWSEVEHRTSRSMFYLNAVPHDWLLPKCKMIIHHGGAGTTSAGLRAGIPQVVVPFTADQPFWGRRVHAVGAGPKPIFVRNLSVEKLTQAIARAESKTVRERAQVIGQKVRSEGGVKRAVELVQSHVSNFINFKV